MTSRENVSQEFRIRPIGDADGGWIRDLLRDHWGSERVVTRGRVVYADNLPGYIAVSNDERVGLVTFHIRGNECEIVSLNSMKQRRGIGSALLDAARQAAQRAACARVWLITTNDNLTALGFYQKFGMHLAALYPNAMEKSRTLKPEIPLVGIDGIPLRDEIELEYMLQ